MPPSQLEIIVKILTSIYQGITPEPPGNEQYINTEAQLSDPPSFFQHSLVTDMWGNDLQDFRRQSLVFGAFLFLFVSGKKTQTLPTGICTWSYG